jgi:hypothetical protein
MKFQLQKLQHDQDGKVIMSDCNLFQDIVFKFVRKLTCQALNLIPSKSVCRVHFHHTILLITSDTYSNLYIYIHTRTRARTHTHTHTHTHPHTHIYTC